MKADRITACLRRRIERVAALRQAALLNDYDVPAWKRHAERGNRLRDALLSYLSS